MALFRPWFVPWKDPGSPPVEPWGSVFLPDRPESIECIEGEREQGNEGARAGARAFTQMSRQSSVLGLEV